MGKSDHDIVVVHPHLSDRFVLQKTYTAWTRNCGHNEKAFFSQALKQVSWETMYYMGSGQDQFNFFTNIMDVLIDSFLLWIQVKRNTNDKLWVTDHFRGLVQMKHSAKKHENKEIYNGLKIKLHHMSRNLKSSYYNRKVKDASAKEFWQIVNALTQSNRNTKYSLQCLANLVTNGDMNQLADEINEFFRSISEDLPPINPPAVSISEPVLDQFIVSVDSVEKQLMSTKIHKAPGPDGIPNWVLRDFAPVLAGPIAAIVNSSVREAFIPECWKRADVVPLAKVNPPKTIQKDLRPVSLTPSISKSCLEHFVFVWLWECVKDQIHPIQYGGRKGSSPVYALIKMLHDWYSGTDKPSTLVDIVLIDYQKAFDRINHNIVLQKLEIMGVPQFLLNWVTAFLHDRKQRVKISNICSPWVTVNGGVPQGTKIAVLLFVVMINDLHTDEDNVKFMDDTTMYEVRQTIGPNHIQQGLNKVANWSKDNDMDVNTRKTKHLPINFTNQQGASVDLTLNGEPIEKVKVAKLLGVQIQSDLKWDAHVTSIVSKASSRLRSLTILKRSGMSQNKLKEVYVARIRSVLEYACMVWNPGLSKQHQHDIERVQKRALHIIEPNLTYQQALRTLSLPTLEDRRHELCKKCYIKICEPENPLHSLLPPKRDLSHNIRGQKDRINPKLRTKRAEGSFIHYGVKHFE